MAVLIGGSVSVFIGGWVSVPSGSVSVLVGGSVSALVGGLLAALIGGSVAALIGGSMSVRIGESGAALSTAALLLLPCCFTSTQATDGLLGTGGCPSQWLQGCWYRMQTEM